MSNAGKHLKTGSECPPLKENQLRLYSMRFCPFVRRAKLVLAAKNIPYEEVFINLADPPEWFLKKNPPGEVPVLEWIDSKTKEVRLIPESLVVSDYLDELYPQNRLQPADPYAKAKQQVLVGRFGSVQSAFYEVLGDDSKTGIENLNKSLAVYEGLLDDTFFGGSKPAMVDYMLWPWFSALHTLSEAGFVLNADGKLPKLAAWVKAMKADEAVRQTAIPEELIQKFRATIKQGKIDYDVE
jgi:glutathione S-transferase